MSSVMHLTLDPTIKFLPKQIMSFPREIRGSKKYNQEEKLATMSIVVLKKGNNKKLIIYKNIKKGK